MPNRKREREREKESTLALDDLLSQGRGTRA
jgi:hypothetical protein